MQAANFFLNFLALTPKISPFAKLSLRMSETAAAPGYYIGTTGASSTAAQVAAAPGYYIGTTGASSTAAQVAAAAGYYVASPGASAQTKATAGHYVASTGATAQTTAPIGYYVATAGATAPTAVGAGYYVNITGATAEARVVMITMQLGADTGQSSTDKITSGTTITGVADAYAVVTLKQGNSTLGTATADGGGNWSFTPTSLTQGSHTISAGQADLVDLTKTVNSASLTFTYDTLAPVVRAQLTSDTGSSSTDQITANPALTGKADANAVVVMKEGASTLGTVTANANGGWSFAPTALAQGTHTIVASETDLAGNADSASLTFTFDTSAPGVSIALATDAGASSADRVTNSAALNGTTEANLVVVLKEGASTLGTVTANAGGNWSFTPAALTQGTHTIVATAKDLAGNTGSASLTFTYDTAAPTVRVKLTRDTGSSSTDKITSNAALSGTADANAAVILKEGAVTLGTATANAAGNWSFTPTDLTQGAHTVMVSQTDLAGNTSMASLSLTYDSIAPTGIAASPVTTTRIVQFDTIRVFSSPIAVLRQTGGPAADSYSFLLASGSSPGLALTSSGTLSARSALIGASGGTVFTANVLVTDRTNGLTATSMLPVAIVVGSSAGNSINLVNLGLAATTPSFIYGAGGVDTLVGTGMSAALSFVGGAGADAMTGGSGVNGYFYGAAGDSSSAAMDIISNFAPAADFIDLTGIYGPVGTLSGGYVAGTTLASLVPAKSVMSRVSGGNTFIYVNGSASERTLSNADMKIELQGIVALTGVNFHI